MRIQKTATLRGRGKYCPNLRLAISLVAILSCLQGFGQEGKKFTITANRAPITVVFSQIEKQSDYRVFYLQRLIERARPVTVTLKGASITQVLDEAFKEQPLTYAIENSSILVREKRAASTAGQDTGSLVTGQIVTSEEGKPLAGATIRIKESKRISIADMNGKFAIRADAGQTLVITYIGFREYEQPVAGFEGTIRMVRQDDALETVNVISSGYQNIPKERATGSFDFIDNKTFNRAVSTDLLSRLEGLGNGLLFTDRSGNSLGISIRGRSTLFSNTQPLIVLDNFPYEGRIENINPNDIESISLLKDAAAASIWGTRAGNGVLVVTTKRGKLNRPAQVNFNSNVTVTNKPDLHYQPRIGTADYIDVERFLFDQGYYNGTINTKYKEISPVVNILNKQRSGQLTAAEANQQIEALSHNDILADMEKYLYQRAVKQQYQINVSGGGQNNSYYLSMGYDKNLSNTIGNSYERYTVKGVNTFYGLKNRLQFTSDLNFTTSKDRLNNSGYSSPKYPYLRLADDNGNPLEVNTNSTLNPSYTDTVGGGYLLDWKYKPLEELRNKSNQTSTNTNNFIINLNLNYKILKELSVNLYYQYNKQVQDAKTIYDKGSFYARNQINSLSQINRQTGVVTRPIPLGEILNSSIYSREGNYGRMQLVYQTDLGKGKLNALAGYEVKENKGLSNNIGYEYGYNRENETFQAVDFITLFRNYYSGATSAIPSGQSRNSSLDRGISYYGNLSYVWDERYLATFSLRKDESNLFGVKSNQRGVPLWSAGIGWNIHKEKFFHSNWISYLKLRATYGYNGNVNNQTSAYLTAASTQRLNLWQVPFNRIINPPNPSLRWEKVENINIGADFALFNNRISGSAEYYVKNGNDLMGYSPLAPQTGNVQFFGNAANTTTKGLDIKLSSVNITNTTFSWESTALINLNSDKVTKYLANPGVNSYILANGISIISPIEGKPISLVAGYRYAGLNETGDPLGYLDGKVSNDYTAMINSSDRENLKFFGSGAPTLFGSLRNTFRYHNLELSFTFLLKAGYYFRRPSFISSYLIGSSEWTGIGDYNDRWQKPGDEAITNVPRLVYPFNSSRDGFYRYSSYLIENASHIRLQDVQLNYQMEMAGAKNRRSGLKNLNLYLYASNLGIIWKATKEWKDPTAVGSPPIPLSISAGIRATF